MSLSSRISVGCVAASLVVAAACGARSALDDDALGVGGGEVTRGTTASFDATATATHGSNGATGPTSSSSGIVTSCTSLSLDVPQLAVDELGGVFAPELTSLPGGHALLTFIELASGNLVGSEIDAFAGWPPALPVPADLVVGLDTYVVAPGPEGPVGYFNDGFGGGALATRVWPLVELANAPIMGAGAALFVTAIPGRYFYGWGDPFGVLEFGSYAPGGLPQSEDPLVCVSNPLAAAIPAGDGFLAAIGRPNPPEPACFSQVPQPPAVISMVRQDDLPGAVDLATTVTDLIVLPERLYHVALTPTSFGGWLVYQTDGSASFEQPGVRAMPVLRDGQPMIPGADPIQVSPDGLGLNEIAAASMGDALVVAYVDALDPSAPSIILQRVEADGTLGATASIPTATVWLTGRIRLLAAPDGREVLVAWEGGLGSPVIGLARVSCFLGT